VRIIVEKETLIKERFIADWEKAIFAGSALEFGGFRDAQTTYKIHTI
jgi:hypothetical protein